jgi:hypothetical protein
LIFNSHETNFFAGFFPMLENCHVDRLQRTPAFVRRRVKLQRAVE